MMTRKRISKLLKSTRGVSNLLFMQRQWMLREGEFAPVEENRKIEKRQPFTDKELVRILDAAIDYLTGGRKYSYINARAPEVKRPNGISPANIQAQEVFERYMKRRAEERAAEKARKLSILQNKKETENEEDHKEGNR